MSKTYLLEEGITCIWCTHNLDELDQVCENFGIMSDGKIKVFKDLNEKDTLCESYTFKVLSKDLKKLDSNNFNYDLISKEEEFVQIKINSNGMSLNTCLKFFLNRDIKIFSIDKNYFKKEIKKKLFEQ